MRALRERKHETKDVLVLMYRAVSSERSRTKMISPVALAIRVLVKDHELDNYMKES